MNGLIIRILLMLIAAGAGAYGAIVATARPARSHPFFHAFSENGRPVVIAHRGGGALWPENTLEGFRGSLALGADMLEMDAHLTADGVPVVMHDDRVDRTTNGSGLISDLTLEEIQALDAAYHFSPPDAPEATPLRGTGITVPTLRSVFEAFPEAHIILEVKDADPRLVDTVLALLREFDRVERTLLGSFHQDVLERIRKKDARVATNLSEDEIFPFLVASWLFSGHLLSPPGEAMLVPPTRGRIPVTTRRFITAADRRNIFVAPWTINDPDEMKQLIDRGVHGLISDRPDLAVSVVADAVRE
jgi:glycerophosphoryl diester phosphodiesterase